MKIPTISPKPKFSSKTTPLKRRTGHLVQHWGGPLSGVTIRRTVRESLVLVTKTSAGFYEGGTWKPIGA